MMKLKVLFAALLISGPAFSKESHPLVHALLPSGIEVDLRSVEVIEKEALSAGQGYMSTAISDIGMTGIRIEKDRSRKTGLTVSADSLSIASKFEHGAKISLSGLVISYSDIPDYEGDELCANLKVIDSIKADGIRIARKERGAAVPSQVEIRDFSYKAGQSRNEGCFLEGALTAENLTTILAAGQNQVFEGLRVDLRLPATVEDADSLTAAATIKVTARSAEFSRSREVPSAGFSNLSADMRFEGQSLIGMIQVIRSRNLFDDPDFELFRSMQYVNAFSMITGQAEISAPLIRLYAAGVVPQSAVANFSKAGLSTMSGQFNGKFRYNQGIIDGGVDLSLLGLFGLTGTLAMDVAPYPGEKLEAAREGKSLGLHGFPDIGLLSFSIKLMDGGMIDASQALTGVPIQSYIRGLAHPYLSDSENPAPLSYHVALDRIVEYVDRIARGGEVELTARPLERKSILTAIGMLLRDPIEFARFANLGY